MRLTSFTDYSLRVLVFLAAAPQGRATIAEIALAFGISENHLAKVVHALGKEGILRNKRGCGGGLRLARAAADINLGKVVRLTEGLDMPAECFDRQTNTCPLAGGCRLQGVLRRAVEKFYEVLGQYTVEDLRARSRNLSRVLSSPAPRRALQ